VFLSPKAVGAAVAIALALALPSSAVAAPGDPDPLFGSGGLFTAPQQTRLPGYGEQFVDIDSQGRPVMAWTVDNGNVFDNDDLTLAVARLTPAGQLDATFNPGGATPGIMNVNFSDAPGSNVAAAGVAVTPADQVVALGTVDEETSTPRLGLVRLTTAGGYDVNFSGDGRLVVGALGTYSPLPHKLAIDSNGQPLVAGTGVEGCPLCDFYHRIPFVARFTAAGLLDSTWDGDGHAEPTGSIDGEMFAVAPSAGGNVVAAGRDGLDAVVTKLSSTGAPVGAFSTDGVATTRLGASGSTGCGSNAIAFGVADGGSGRVLLAGQATLTDCTARFAVARLGADGLPDQLWGTNAPDHGLTWLPTGATRSTEVTLQPDGKVLASGLGSYPGPGQSAQNSILLARLTTTGALDSSFGSGGAPAGIAQTRLGQSAGGSDLKLQPDGKPLVSGYRWATGGTDVKPVLVRYLGDSTPPADGDGDGTPDGIDNCPSVSNPAQADADSDGIGDACDSTPGGGGGGGSSPPIAEFAYKSRSPTLGRTVYLNGRGSTAATGRSIVSYAWDLTSDGRFDFVAPGNSPAISTTIRKAGSYRATLTVIDSAGESDTVSQPYTVGKRDTNRGPSFTTFEQPAGGSNQADRPGCVKTVAFGIVEVNGRGGPNQCFRLEFTSPDQHVSIGDFNPAARSAQAKRLDETRVLYRAEIDGPVALNGLPIPLPSGFTTRYEAWQSRVDLGRVSLQLPLPGGSRVRLGDVDLGFAVPTSGSVQLPPLSTTSLPRFAGLKLGGAVDVVLRKEAAPTASTVGTEGSRFVSQVGLALTLPNFLSDSSGNPIQGNMRFEASNTNPLRVASAGLEVPDAFIGPLKVDSLSLTYQGPPEDTFQAAANFRFPSIAILGAPPPVRGVGIRGGAFDYAGLAVEFQPPSQPVLFPGVNLRRVEGRFEVDPIVVSGGLGITVAGVIGIDGDMLMALASPQKPFTLPPGTAPPGLTGIEGRRMTSFAFAIGANASLLTPAGDIPLANAHVFYHYPSLLEFDGGFRFRLGGDSAPYVELKGGVGGWASFAPRRFNIEGNNEVCFGIPTPPPFADIDLCQGVFGLVSSRGAFACAKNISIAPVPPFFIPEIGLGWIWGEGGIPDISLFTCKPSKYREEQPPTGARAAQAGSTFDIPRGLDAAQVRIVGAGGAPAVDLRGPNGTQISVPLDGEQADNTTGDGFLAMRMDATTVQIGLRKPAAGRWTVTTRAGSARIDTLAVAENRPAPKLSARVLGRGHSRRLRYRVEPAAGQRVRFVEQGARTYHELGVAKGATGTIRFAPAPGGRGRRKIVAYIDQDGVTVDRRNVARYTAPDDALPAKPRRVRVKRKGATINVSWRRARNVKSYGVVVQMSNRRKIFRVTSRPRLTLRGFHRLARGRVSVRSLRAGERSSRPATARIKALKKKAHRRRSSGRRSAAAL